MTKIITIEIEETDEFVLLEIFKRFNVKVLESHLTNGQSELYQSEPEEDIDEVLKYLKEKITP